MCPVRTDTGLTIYVYDAFGKMTSEYTNFPAGVQPCTTCYLSQDHLGNTRLVTDEAGNTVARHDYRPFGEELIAGDGFRGAEWGKYDGVKQKFTGQEHDGETEFDFFHARYLSGAQQRFMSADPGNAGADPMNPQSWNAYSYVGNNPLARIDPTGMSFVPCELPDSIACVGNDPPGKGDSGGGNDPFDPCFLCLLPRCILCIGFGGGTPSQEIPLPPAKFTVTATANPQKKGTCTAQRIALAFKGLVNLGIGQAKINLASASSASIPATGPVGAAGAAYGIIGGIGNATAGAVQIIRAITGNVRGASYAANAITTTTTVAGLTTLIATNGNMEQASTAAAFESLGTAGINGGITGRLIDRAASSIQKIFLSADLAQNAADAAGVSTEGTCRSW